MVEELLFLRIFQWGKQREFFRGLNLRYTGHPFLSSFLRMIFIWIKGLESKAAMVDF